MSWSYSPSDLNTTTASGRLNTVRLLVGDTDTTDQLVQNEEITFALSQTGDMSTMLLSGFVAPSLPSSVAWSLPPLMVP